MHDVAGRSVLRRLERAGGEAVRSAPNHHGCVVHDDQDRLGRKECGEDTCGDVEPEVPEYAAPARAAELSGLPPAFIDVGSAETFRDEAVTYASRIWQAGGTAELHVWPGGFHGYDVLAPQAAISQTTRTTRVQWLRRLLGE